MPAYPPPPLHQLLYVSLLKPDAPLSVVADIARRARVANKELDITGVLVFDGQRFCQHLEGSMKAVATLFEDICRDTRHINVGLLHQGSIDNRRYLNFSMGFADLQDVDQLEELERLSGEPAVAAFDLLYATLDMNA